MPRQTPALPLTPSGKRAEFSRCTCTAGRRTERRLHSLSSFLACPARILMTWTTLRPAWLALLYLLLPRQRVRPVYSGAFLNKAEAWASSACNDDAILPHRSLQVLVASTAAYAHFNRAIQVQSGIIYCTLLSSVIIRWRLMNGPRIREYTIILYYIASAQSRLQIFNQNPVWKPETGKASPRLDNSDRIKGMWQR
jgi:hypothetical protein